MRELIASRSITYTEPTAEVCTTTKRKNSQCPPNGLSYDANSQLPALTSRLEELGGKLVCCSTSSVGTSMAMQVPIVNPIVEKLTPSERELEEVVRLRLEVAVYERNAVYEVGITHFLWSRGIVMLRCESVEEAVQVLETRKPAVLLWDVDDTDGEMHAARMQSKAKELNVMMITTTTLHDKAWEHQLLKPIAEQSLVRFLKRAVEHVSATAERQAQVVKMREIFTGYHSSDWERGQLIGKGAFGSVYVANFPQTGGRMAVKIIDLDPSNEGLQSRVDDLMNEVDILRTMDHPNVIHYFYCERGASSVNVFMELASGGSVGKLLRDGELSLSRVTRILKEVLEAIAYIHELGIVHRDIKADNVLLSEGNVVKLSDFGVSTRLRDGVAHGLKGTLRWMAPEVMREEPYGTACDIWSFGCLVVEMLTRRPPFWNINPTNPLHVFNHLSSLPLDATAPFETDEDVWKTIHLKSFVDGCLQMDPKKRSNARMLGMHPFIQSGISSSRTSSLSSPSSPRLVPNVCAPNPMGRTAATPLNPRSIASAFDSCVLSRRKTVTIQNVDGAGGPPSPKISFRTYRKKSRDYVQAVVAASESVLRLNDQTLRPLSLVLRRLRDREDTESDASSKSYNSTAGKSD